MPTLYARQAALPNVRGRCDYISNPKRQEHLLGVYDGAASLLQGRYWKQLASESQAAFERFGQKIRMIKNRKTGEMEEKKLKAVEGREIHGKLPKSLLKRLQPEEIARILAEDFQRQYNRPAMVAIHQSKNQENLHFHLIYSERQLLQEPVSKVATRNLFFDEQGKRHYKKAEVLDEAGELRPGCRIVPKGDVYETKVFGSVDQSFSRRAWIRAAKTDWLLPLLNGPLRDVEKYIEFDPASGKLAQQKVEKWFDDAVKADIEEQNRLRREWNRAMEEHLISIQASLRYQEEMKLHAEKTSLLKMTIDMIHMVASDYQYKPEWIQDEPEAPIKAVEIGGTDWLIQAQLNALQEAREQGCTVEEALDQARRRVGRELAAARNSGDQEQQRQTRRQYAGVAKAAAKAHLSFEEQLAAAQQRQNASKKRRSVISEKEK